MKQSHKINFASAVNEALSLSMERDESVICYGLGVGDPKRVFGTTAGLQEKFGKHRVFDMPTSENAMTGVAIGASLNGINPVMVHQRLDFFLLAMDQLVNNAAKWHYMFGGKSHVPITIRLIIGRGWGQGPTHSQNLQSWFAHIPGLKVVMPTTANEAKGLLISSIFDNNPTVFLEHRWLYDMEGKVEKGFFKLPIGKARKVKKGKDITIVAFSYMMIEALRAVDTLEKNGISCELIDLQTLKPIDWETVFGSVKKTGCLMALDTGVQTCSVSSEIIATVSMECFDILKCSPIRIALKDIPTPTSFALTKTYYNRAVDIVLAAGKMMKCKALENFKEDDCKIFHDVPGDWFKGPF